MTSSVLVIIVFAFYLLGFLAGKVDSKIGDCYYKIKIYYKKYSEKESDVYENI